MEVYFCVISVKNARRKLAEVGGSKSFVFLCDFSKKCSAEVGGSKSCVFVE